MKNKIIIYLTLFLFSCGSRNFTASKVIDGNSFELNNGITVTLFDVEKNPENIKILERYLRGNILLYNKSDEEIKSFSSDQIMAMVYNSDGDCVNHLLASVSEITKEQPPELRKNNSDEDKTLIKFEQESGVLHIPVIINSVEMYFIFDTGAGLISISQSVADDLYRKGKLFESDILGKGNFSDANGDISEGTIINLTSVIIGNRELNNVKACVIQGQNAPLLFGQSALQKFGKVSIDYKTNEITFE